MNDADIQLIETMRIDPGPSLPLLPWHRKRLEASCAALGYRWPGERLFLDIGRLAAGLDPAASHRLRLLLDRNGVYTLSFGTLPPTPEPVHLRLDTRARKAEQQYLLHKTTHRPWYEEAQEWLAIHPNVFDVIYCNTRGEVCEGSRSNIYVQDDEGNWLTPPTSCGLLPGVMRQSLLDQGLVREAKISRDDLESAPALRVSNALRGWLTARLIRAKTRWQ